MNFKIILCYYKHLECSATIFLKYDQILLQNKNIYLHPLIVALILDSYRHHLCFLH